MDPPHITEFASQRYFDKLRHLSEPKDGQPQDPGIAHAHDGTAAAPPPPFILPIGRPRSPDHTSKAVADKRHHRHPFSFRSILPSRTSTDHDARRLSTDSVKQRRSLPFDQLFAALPNELKIQIIASLPLSDVLSLRLASRSWHAMVSHNEVPIARYHLQHHVPAYAVRLYPSPDPANIKLHYLCGIWHRLLVAAKLSYLISEWVTKEMFLRGKEEQRQQFAPQHERMRRRLIPLLFTIYHFFETYRIRHVEYIKEHGHGLSQEPYTLNPIELEVMKMYDDQTLLRVHQVFPLVVSSFRRRLRPPTYAGRLERSLRGYLRDPPPDHIHVAAMCVGGLRQVERFWEIKGYNSRRGAVDAWYSAVSKEPPDSAKPRRGLRGLTRKMSSMNVGDVAKSHGDTSTPMIRGRRGSDGTRRNSDASSTSNWDNIIFDTSLAAGMPMEPLSRDDLRLLVPDLPLLQQLWLPTAEALILERKIVERPQDIKRNAQVMLDLIREDGAAEEDEWWYGRAAPESVRPPLEAIEEDTLE
jgi:hypothetical protein